MKPLLLEIGTEEIPARFIPEGMRSLKEGIVRLLKENYIDFGDIYEYATPRRLAVVVKDVSEKQKDRKTEVLGPPKKIAYDEKGNPTAAAEGFAKSQNVDIKKLKIAKTDRGEYVAVSTHENKRETKDILAELLPSMITSLQFPKSMRWGSSRIRFVRPIQWITAIFSDSKIQFELDGIKSSDMTRGHRFLSPGTFRIKDPANYQNILSNNYVIAAPDIRKEKIIKKIKKIESDLSCRVYEDRELLETVTFLVEFPTVILGNFDAEYISLPRELIITVLKNHQKCFSVEDKKNKLLPHFILVSNTVPENSDTVRRGAERVLNARLEDAKFYFKEDSKIPLWNYIEKLKNVTFQEKLGSVYEKVERVAFICTFLADELNLTTREKILRAVMLSKADLVTGIVREFPELQGYIGMVYAGNSGEDEEIATAIHEHYKPRFSGDSLPSSEIGTIIALADKMDTIVSFFSVGLIPTGSEDPFALRRQTIGVINILLNEDYSFSLGTLIDKALQGVESYIPAIKTLKAEILKFFYQRIEGIFLSEGYNYDIVDSVLSVRELPPHRRKNLKDIKTRIKVLSVMKEESGFLELLTAAKRVYNILSKVKPVEIKEDLLIETAEKDLFSVMREVRDKLTQTDYKALFELKNPVNTFFDNVLVMDKKPEIRQNRLGLLFSVKGVFDLLGDFSMISE